MGRPYPVKCVDSRYDGNDEVLVLVLLFEDFGGYRVIHLPRSDFHFKAPGNEVPENEMHRTAHLFQGKRFEIVIDDDPSRNPEADKNSEKIVLDFRKKLGQQFDEVTEGLENKDRRMARKLGDIIEKDKGSLDKMLGDELTIRRRLNDIQTGQNNA